MRKRLVLTFAAVLMVCGQSQPTAWGQGEDILAKIVRYGGSIEEIQDEEQKLREAEWSFGPASPQLIPYLGRLADLYRDRGLMTEAADLWRRNLAIEERFNLKDVYPGQLRSRALLCISLGDLEKGEVIYRQLVEMMEKEMEKETKGVKVRDPAGLTIALKELADHLTLEKKFAEAEPIHKRVIEIDSRAYGPLDELTLGDMRKLAEFYLAQGKYTEAETQYRKVLEAVGRRNLSPSARATVGVSQDDITKLYVKQGRYADAEKIYRNSLGGSSFIPFANLAAVLVMQGKVEEAEEFRKRALELWASNVEMGYSPAVNALNELAQAYHTRKNDVKAEEVYRFVLAAWDQKALWPAAYGRRFLREQLTALIREQGREADAALVELQDAQTYWRKWMVVCDRTYAAGRFDDSARYVLEAIREAVLGFGANHTKVADTLDRYADILRKRNRASAAQEIQARAMLIRSQSQTK